MSTDLTPLAVVLRVAPGAWRAVVAPFAPRHAVAGRGSRTGRDAARIFWLCIFPFAAFLTVANAVADHPAGVGWGLLATCGSALLAWRPYPTRRAGSAARAGEAVTAARPCALSVSGETDEQR